MSLTRYNSNLTTELSYVGKNYFWNFYCKEIWKPVSRLFLGWTRFRFWVRCIVQNSDLDAVLFRQRITIRGIACLKFDCTIKNSHNFYAFLEIGIILAHIPWVILCTPPEWDFESISLLLVFTAFFKMFKI